jgi:hypothetical protein
LSADGRFVRPTRRLGIPERTPGTEPATFMNDEAERLRLTRIYDQLRGGLPEDLPARCACFGGITAAGARA